MLSRSLGGPWAGQNTSPLRRRGRLPLLAALGGALLGLPVQPVAAAPAPAAAAQASPASAAAPGVELEVRRKALAILLKAITLDANLGQRCPTMLRLGIVARGFSEASRRDAALTEEAVRAFLGKRVKGKLIVARVVTADSPEEVARAVETFQLNTLLLSSDLGALGPALAALAGERDLLLLASDAANARHATLTVLRQANNKPKLLYNQDAGRAQGAAFDKSILGLAELVR